MSSWILFAVTGHIMNAIAFIIDKTLLKSTFKQGATYAILISLLSIIVLFAAPWVHIWPHHASLLDAAIFGLCQTSALWAFFEALKRGEASRVVPIVGVLVALFTFLGISLTIGETFGVSQYIGFGLLVISTGILAWGGVKDKEKRNSMVFALAFTSAILFAISSVSGKNAFVGSDFIGVFVASRFYMLVGGLILLLAHKKARQEILHMAFPPKKSAKPIGGRAMLFTLIAQSAGAIGFILVNYAIALGSASLVNAMQAVQYGFIVLVAWFGGKKLRTLLNEPKTPMIIAIKSFAVFLVAFGLFLISHVSIA